METPSSAKMVITSQASSASQKIKQEDPLSRSRNGGNQDRMSLLDITNDSPIVGLAMSGLLGKTPSSLVVKAMVRAKRTPGSGEDLLRDQVKTLLQKVEEEAEFVNKVSLRPPIRAMLGFPSSPIDLLAPTPANTPHIPNLKEEALMGLMMPSVIKIADPIIPQQFLNAKKRDEPLGRALLFDSPGKSELSHTSTISFEGSGNKLKERSSKDDSSSAWSLQVNASIQEEDEEGTDDFEGQWREDAEGYNGLCEGLLMMSVKDRAIGLPEFTGKHTRFMYNSDDEIEGEEEVKAAVSPSVLLLKGLPIPQGKHLRFQEEEED